MEHIKDAQAASLRAQKERWHELFQVMGSAAFKNPKGLAVPDPEDIVKPTGSLVVVGSGIASISQLTLEAIAHIKSSERVFFCVADSTTEAWILQHRPDAYDLYVLYSNSKQRGDTYTQMSESVLYCVRCGLSVCLVLYGHPGVFVNPSHRAIQIARSEGHNAKMLPAVSAEDCLFADLGFDPSYPGLMTLEASDMLLREREPNVYMHVVIWQVGCVGDFGFRRKGFLNPKFHVLVDYLETFYGPDHLVTHYIAAQYASCDAVIEKFKISDLKLKSVHQKFNGISTMYIPPLCSKPTTDKGIGCLDMSATLKPGPTTPLRIVDRYGPAELKAIKDFLKYHVPDDYVAPCNNPMQQVMIKVGEDPEFAASFKKNANPHLEPLKLNAATKALLKSNNNSYVRYALRGPTPDPPNEALLKTLALNRTFCRQFHQQQNIQAQDYQNGEANMTAWIQAQGYNTTYDQLLSTLSTFQQTSLLTWSGTYKTTDGSLMIAIIGAEALSGSSVFLNSVPIANFQFTSSTLTWSQKDGNTCSGSLVFTPASGTSTLPSFSGQVSSVGTLTHGNRSGLEKVYSAQQQSLGSSIQVTGSMYSTPSTLATFEGSYSTLTTTDGANWVQGPVLIVTASANPWTPGAATVTLGGAAITDGTFNSTNNSYSWQNNTNRIVFSFNTAVTPNAATFTGKVTGLYPLTDNFKGSTVSQYMVPWTGPWATYTMDSQKNVAYEQELVVNGGIDVASSTVMYGGVAIKNFTFSGTVLSWKQSDGNSLSAVINFLKTRTFYGKLWNGTTAPSVNNYFGNLDVQFTSGFSGMYKSFMYNSKTGKYDIPGSEITLVGGSDIASTKVYVDATQITSALSWNSPILSWTTGGSSFSLTFYNSTTASITGKVFVGSISSSAGLQMVTGLIDTSYMISWGGNYYTETRPTAKGSYVTGPFLQVRGTGMSPTDTTIIFNGTIINKWTYGQNILQWNIADNPYAGSAKITFYIPQPSDKAKSYQGPSFFGGYASGSLPTDTSQWIGQQHCYPDSDSLPWYAQPWVSIFGVVLLFLSAVAMGAPLIQKLWLALKRCFQNRSPANQQILQQAEQELVQLNENAQNAEQNAAQENPGENAPEFNANPAAAEPEVANAEVANAEVANAEVANAEVANAEVANAEVANAEVANAEVANAEVAAAEVANAEVAAAEVAAAEVAVAEVAEVAVEVIVI